MLVLLVEVAYGRQAAEPRGTCARLRSYSARTRPPRQRLNKETSTYQTSRTRASTTQSNLSPSWPPYLILAFPQSTQHTFTQGRLEQPALPNRILILKQLVLEYLADAIQQDRKTTQISQAKMSGKANPSSDSTGASGSSSSKSFTPYTVTSSGTNSQVRPIHPPSC